MPTAACFQRKSATLCNGKLDMWSLCCISTLKKKDNLESVTREGLRFSSCTGTGSVLKNRVFVYPRFPTGRADSICGVIAPSQMRAHYFNMCWAAVKGCQSQVIFNVTL